MTLMVPGIAISGIKLSAEMTQITVMSPRDGGQLLRLMAEHRINVQFLSAGLLNEGMCGSYCIPATEHKKAVAIIMPHEALNRRLRWIRAVGAVTVFPHRSRLHLIGLILQEVGRAGLPLYSLATSLSTITFTTAFARIEEVVSTLCRHVALPDNHAPFHPEFRIDGRERA